MKNNVGSIIKKLRQEKNLTQDAMAKELGVSTSVVKKWESNERLPRFTKQEEICDLFNVDMNYLLGLTPIKVSLSEDNIIEIPLYDCSRLDQNFNIDCMMNTIVLPKFMLRQGTDYFAVCIRDNSIMDCNLKKGDIAVFEKTRYISPYQIGLFIVNNEVYCRHYIVDKKIVNLWSYNSEYPSFNNAQNYIVLGKLALKISNEQYGFLPETDL